jgi:signal transduction histidine kinase
VSPRARAAAAARVSRFDERSAPTRWSAEAVRAREQAREEERRHLARELHDELGQALLGLKMNLASMLKRLSDPAGGDLSELRAKLPDMLDLVERAVHTVSAIVTDLRPPTLDQLGLVAALEWQAESFARRTGLRCQFTATADVSELDVGRATAVFRMFQEMLTNVARHARANHVTVLVERRGDELTLCVRDNGLGVSPERALARSSYGLLGMRERAALLGGSLAIESAPRRGTTVTATIPLANRRARARPSPAETAR